MTEVKMQCQNCEKLFDPKGTVVLNTERVAWACPACGHCNYADNIAGPVQIFEVVS